MKLVLHRLLPLTLAALALSVGAMVAASPAAQASPGCGHSCAAAAAPAATVHIASTSKTAVPAVGPTPTAPDFLICGGERDVPSQWTATGSGNSSKCAGTIPGFSYILTSPSSQHSALYPMNDIFTGTWTFEVWIPASAAGQLAEYDYEVGTTWHVLGTVNQEANSYWYDIGLLPQNVLIAAIRVRSIGGNPGACGLASCYLAEAAVGWR